MVPIQYLLQGQSLFGQGIIGQPQFYGANMATNFIAPCFGNIPWYFWGISHEKVPWNRMVCPGVPAISHIRYWILRHSYILYHIFIYSQFSIFFCLWKVRLQVLLLAGFSSLRLIPVWSLYMCYHMVPLLTGCLENLENPSTLPIPACTNENKREQQLS